MKSLGRSRWMAGGSGGPAADSFRPAPRGGAAGRGRNEWAGEAKRVGNFALICSRPEDGRGKTLRRVQMSAIRALVRQGVPGAVLAFHSDKDCRCGRQSRSVGLVPCFHSSKFETPSPSLSRCTKPGMRVSMPFS
jgi:hypothetical protein